MFDTMEIREIFPTPLWVVDLAPAIHLPLNARLIASIEKLTTPRPPIALGLTWQTDPFLHQLPEFADFVTLVRKAAKAAIDTMVVEHSGFEITGCWANINPRGSMNTAHTHPNNYLSGVYYLQIPEGAGVITFNDPRGAAGVVMPKQAGPSKYNANGYTLDAKPGRLVLFPAWLRHAVPINRSERERISMSFNIMFTGFTEMAKPLWRGRVARIEGAVDKT